LVVVVVVGGVEPHRRRHIAAVVVAVCVVVVAEELTSNSELQLMCDEFSHMTVHCNLDLEIFKICPQLLILFLLFLLS
jgi:energy-converting hydrogenase Eha subunit G